MISTLFSRAVSIVGVQQFVRQMAVRLVQEFAVQRLDIRVLVGLTKRQALVHLIQAVHTVRADRCGGSKRLSAAANAAARAAHNFDKLVVRLACTDLVHQVRGHFSGHW